MIHATGKVASAVVEGLRGSPLALPLVIINMLALGLVGFTLHEISKRNESRDALLSKVIQDCSVK